MASRLGTVFKTHKSVASVAQAKTTTGGSLLLVKSTGFMNLSGGPVAAVAKFYSVPTDKIIVIHDELDIEFGDIRKKFDGGHAGPQWLEGYQRQVWFWLSQGSIRHRTTTRIYASS